MGAGGVGGYYGGLLATAGQEVTFIARGDHLQAIRGKGLQVKSVHGDFTVSPARATDHPGEVGSVDLVIVATKTYHTDEAAQAIRPSMQRDLEAGRSSELESLIGVVVRSGSELGVPTPVTRIAYALLKPAHLKAQGKG